MIANEFAIHKGITLLCGRDETDHLTPFMDELRHTGASQEFRESVMSESIEMLNKIGVEEPEYICTPEMFEGAETRVTQAHQQWDEMRGISE